MDRLAHIDKVQYDLVVIGGGSVGAGVARDAAMRGLKTLLVEKGDFGSGTSSRTSKIVHGGIRYLEQGELRLVRESLRERIVLQKIAPHLVRPLPFIIPVYHDGPRPLWKVRIGLWLYDLLSLFGNRQRFGMLEREKVLRLLPGLNPELLQGGGLYYDSRMNDARLVLENVLEAKFHGAEVLNYVKVTRFFSDGKRLTGLSVSDLLSGRQAEVGGRFFVNGGGPWVTEIAVLGGSGNPTRIRMTKGSHIIVPRISGEYGVVISPKDEKRIFFVIPWYGNSLIGTTDVDYSGDPSGVHAEAEEIDYLIRETARFFPGMNLKKEDVISVFSGVRPLLDGSRGDPSSVSRRASIRETSAGMISVAGGKFTIYRSLAEKVVDLVGKRLARTDLTVCATHIEPLCGAKFKGTFDSFLEQKGRRWAETYSLDLPVVLNLISQYGTRAGLILERVGKEKELGQLISPGYPTIRAEILFAVEEEMAQTLSDFLRRRTLLALSGLRNPRILGEIAETMGQKLQWDRSRIEKEVELYLREVNQESL